MEPYEEFAIRLGANLGSGVLKWAGERFRNVVLGDDQSRELRAAGEQAFAAMIEAAGTSREPDADRHAETVLQMVIEDERTASTLLDCALNDSEMPFGEIRSGLAEQGIDVHTLPFDVDSAILAFVRALREELLTRAARPGSPLYNLVSLSTVQQVREAVRQLAAPGTAPMGAADAPVSCYALHQLPPDIADFTGREREVGALIAQLASASPESGPAPIVCAISGMAGVGKSALAIHVAHLVKDRYPYAQLYVDLRGSDDRPLDPDEAVTALLVSLGLPHHAIPKNRDQQVKHLRSLLHHRPALIVLDNADDESQVRPLLPGDSACGVLVTSRRALSMLEGTFLLGLEPMGEDEAIALLEMMAGQEHIQEDLGSARQIVRLCGTLPLALRVAGGRLRARRRRTLAEEVAALSQESTRLAGLAFRGADVEASIMLSYGLLSQVAARLFRYLGCLAGHAFTTELMAALLGGEGGGAKRAIDELVDLQLLLPGERGWWAFHDLVRLVSRNQFTQETARTQSAVSTRAAHWDHDYLHYLSEVLRPGPLRKDVEARLAEGAYLSQQIEDGLPAYAVDWFHREWPNLDGFMQTAAQTGDVELVWSLAAVVKEFCQPRSLWRQLRTGSEAALREARRVADRQQEANWLFSLGLSLYGQGARPQAVQHYEEALLIYRELGDRAGEGRTLGELATGYQSQGDYPSAIKANEDSLRLLREVGDRRGEAVSLSNLGLCYQSLGLLDEAMPHFEAALNIFEEEGDMRGQALSLNNIGSVLQAKGLWSPAIEKHKDSLVLKRHIGDRQGEAISLANLATCYGRSGDAATADALRREAQEKMDTASMGFAQMILVELPAGPADGG